MLPKSKLNSIETLISKYEYEFRGKLQNLILWCSVNTQSNQK